jgi:hypothetical protein
MRIGFAPLASLAPARFTGDAGQGCLLTGPNAGLGRCLAMEHKGIRYEVLQTANPTGFIWTVYLDEKRTRTGVSFSRETAIHNAVRAIDKALGVQPKNAPEI